MRLVLAFFFTCALQYAAAAFIDDDFGDLEIGQPFTVSWDASTPNPINLSLLSNSDPAKPNVLNIANIAVIGSGNFFQWEPAPSLETNLAYVMRLLDGAGGEQLSKQFKLVTRAESSSSTSSSSSSTSTSSPSSTTSPASLVTSTSTQTTSPTSPSQLQTPSSSPTSAPTPKSPSSANTRIAVSMTIVTVLILVAVALIFYEHGKRVASRNQDSESGRNPSFDHADRGDGSDGLQLFEGFHTKDPEAVSVNCSTCNGSATEDSGRDVEEGIGLGIIAQEARQKKMKSMQSIYELG
ncbi:hypothetical protein BKA61DRAFT_260642 [Leptodontidium sp. MPI-SDFR-AT-0119]|nr:hypothetical protein BKA61DRAFT_260642 [Leptodontidium sp. MPI-SDFR-AT-0119]